MIRWIRRFILLVGYSFYLLFFLGLLFYTSPDPLIFGKYSLKYFLFLLSVVGLFFPYLKLLHAMSQESVFVLRSGLKFKITPFHKVLSFVALFFLCLLPFEIYTRLNYERIFKPAPIEQFHPYLQIQSVKNDKDYFINSHGFREEEITVQKPHGAFRIFVLGGSSVYAAEVPFEESHCRVIEKLLKSHYKGKKIEVVNAGYPTYTSEHSIIQYLFKIKEFDPDLIIMWHGFNDMIRSFTDDDAYGEFQSDYSHYFGATSRMVFQHFEREPVFKIRLASLALFSRIFEPLRQMLFGDISLNGKSQREYGQVIETGDFKSLRSYEWNLISFIRILKMDHVDLILGTQPYFYEVNMTPNASGGLSFIKTFRSEGKVYTLAYRKEAGMRLFNDKTKSIAREYHVPMIDLEKVVPKSGEFFVDDIHYTDKGNAVIAHEITAFLIKNHYIR